MPVIQTVFQFTGTDIYMMPYQVSKQLGEYL